MAACTFFGHRDAPKEIEPLLRAALVDLIENHDVALFSVGNHGGFDAMVRRILLDLKKRYPLTVHVVLAYRPTRRDALSGANFEETILPDRIETVPKRFAIVFRNRWMIERSDYVITYVISRIASGAARFQALSEKRGKTVIRLA